MSATTTVVIPAPRAKISPGSLLKVLSVAFVLGLTLNWMFPSLFPSVLTVVAFYLLFFALEVTVERFGKGVSIAIALVRSALRAIGSVVGFFVLLFFISQVTWIFPGTSYKTLIAAHGLVGAFWAEGSERAIAVQLAIIIAVGYAVIFRTLSAKLILAFCIAFIALWLWAPGPLSASLEQRRLKNDKLEAKIKSKGLYGAFFGDPKPKATPDELKLITDLESKVDGLREQSQRTTTRIVPAGGSFVGQTPTGYSSTPTSGFRIQRPPQALHPKTICQGTLCTTIDVCWHNTIDHTLCDGHFVSGRMEAIPAMLTLDDSSVWEDAGRGVLGVGFGFDTFKFKTGGNSEPIPHEKIVPFVISVSDKAETTKLAAFELVVDWERMSRVKFAFDRVPVLPQSAESTQ